MKVDPDLLRTVLLYVEEHGELPEDDNQRDHAKVLYDDGRLDDLQGFSQLSRRP